VFTNFDRLILAILYRFAPGIVDALAIVEPETVIRWHRTGFSLFWRFEVALPRRQVESSARNASKPNLRPRRQVPGTQSITTLSKYLNYDDFMVPRGGIEPPILRFSGLIL
jgi:hypothetical protein